MTRFLVSAAALAGVFLSSAVALADHVSVGEITIGDPWTRATPPKAPTGGGFLTITNKGDEPDRLLSVSADHAGRAEIHEMKVDNDIMVMRPLADGLAVPAGGTVVLEPGGYHLMFMALKAPHVEGEDIPVTLTFDKAGPVEVELGVYPIGSPGPGGGAGDGMDHSDKDHHDHGGHDGHEHK